MNHVTSQLFQWPPTPTTVMGLAVAVGAIASHLTGDPFWGLLAGGLTGITVPQMPAKGAP